MTTHIVNDTFAFDAVEDRALLTTQFHILEMGDLIHVKGGLWEVINFDRYADPSDMYIVELRKVLNDQ